MSIKNQAGLIVGITLMILGIIGLLDEMGIIDLKLLSAYQQGNPGMGLKLSIKPVSLFPLEVVQPGKSYEFELTLRNTGTVNWDSAWIHLRIPNYRNTGKTTTNVPIGGTLTRSCDTGASEFPTGSCSEGVEVGWTGQCVQGYNYYVVEWIQKPGTKKCVADHSTYSSSIDMNQIITKVSGDGNLVRDGNFVRIDYGSVSAGASKTTRLRITIPSDLPNKMFDDPNEINYVPLVITGGASAGGTRAFESKIIQLQNGGIFAYEISIRWLGLVAASIIGAALTLFFSRKLGYI